MYNEDRFSNYHYGVFQRKDFVAIKAILLSKSRTSDLLAQTTGFEIIFMGDFNIDYLNCSNKKWLHLVPLFDLKQMISIPTQVTFNTSSVIHHLYCTNTEHISDCFVPHYSISDHFSIRFNPEKSTIKSKVHV